MSDCHCWTLGVGEPKLARDVMRSNPAHIDADESLLTAVHKLADLHAEAMPVCGPGGDLKGMLSHQDIVTKVLVNGVDPAGVKAGDMVGDVVAVGSQDSVDTALREMREHRVHYLPVLEDLRLVGVIATEDILRRVPGQQDDHPRPH
jgi:CBS domain-containing protein